MSSSVLSGRLCLYRFRKAPGKVQEVFGVPSGVVRGGEFRKALGNKSVRSEGSPIGVVSGGESPRGEEMGHNLGEDPKNIAPILGSILVQKGGSKNDPFLGPPFGPPRCPSWAPLVKIVGSWGPKWVPKWCQNGSQKRPPQNSENCALA